MTGRQGSGISDSKGDFQGSLRKTLDQTGLCKPQWKSAGVAGDWETGVLLWTLSYFDSWRPPNSGGKCGTVHWLSSLIKWLGKALKWPNFPWNCKNPICSWYHKFGTETRKNTYIFCILEFCGLKTLKILTGVERQWEEFLHCQLFSLEREKYFSHINEFIFWTYYFIL